MKRLSIALLALASFAQAEDFPQFRGVGGRGVSKETNLPLKWDETTNVRWKMPLPGRGLSAPVVSKGRVYVTAATGPEQKRLHVLCFDVKTGDRLWERQFWATGGTQCHPKTNMAAPTPIADGQRVYALFATADLVCLDHDGNLEWYRSLVGDYPTVGNNVGMASSPILIPGSVLVHMENVGESFAVAIDRVTGQNTWRIPRPNLINWNTPHLFQNGDKSEVVLATPNGLTAHDPLTGKELWRHTKSRPATMASMTSADGVLYSPGDVLAAVQPTGENVEPKVLWTSKNLPSGYSSPTVVGDFIFTCNNGGIVTCGDAKTGEKHWSQRAQGNTFSGSPLVADNKLFVLAEDGTTTVFEIAKEKKILTVNAVSTGDAKDAFMAGMVAADGAFFLRSDKYLYCVSERK